MPKKIRKTQKHLPIRLIHNKADTLSSLIFKEAMEFDEMVSTGRGNVLERWEIIKGIAKMKTATEDKRFNDIWIKLNNRLLGL